MMGPRVCSMNCCKRPSSSNNTVFDSASMARGRKSFVRGVGFGVCVVEADRSVDGGTESRE